MIPSGHPDPAFFVVAHVEVHSGVVCDDCGMSFRFPWLLATHCETMHTTHLPRSLLADSMQMDSASSSALTSASASASVRFSGSVSTSISAPTTVIPSHGPSIAAQTLLARAAALGAPPTAVPSPAAPIRHLLPSTRDPSAGADADPLSDMNSPTSVLRRMTATSSMALQAMSTAATTAVPRPTAPSPTSSGPSQNLAWTPFSTSAPPRTQQLGVNRFTL